MKIISKVEVFLPNAFTPNGDGINDVLLVQGKGIKLIKTFRIYNRWGELVFETTDLTEAWDGMHKGKLQDVGTFVYYITAKDILNKTKLIINFSI